jgi:hypothetical protein
MRVASAFEGGVVAPVPLPEGVPEDTRVMHHSELKTRKRADIDYPTEALSHQVEQERCSAKVYMDKKGVPILVVIETCPEVFHEAVEAGLMKWRWKPPKLEGEKVNAVATIFVTFKLD